MAAYTFRLPGREQYSYVEVIASGDDVEHPEFEETLKSALAALDSVYPEREKGLGPTTNSSGSTRNSGGDSQQSSSPSKECDHGRMTLKEGKTAKGQWAAYFCPERDRSQQCRPIDAVTGKVWGQK